MTVALYIIETFFLRSYFISQFLCVLLINLKSSERFPSMYNWTLLNHSMQLFKLFRKLCILSIGDLWMVRCSFWFHFIMSKMESFFFQLKKKFLLIVIQKIFLPTLMVKLIFKWSRTHIMQKTHQTSKWIWLL